MNFDDGDVKGTTKEEAEATGEQESNDIGTVTTIVTEPHDNSQPYGVEVSVDNITESKDNYITDFARFCSSATSVILRQVKNIWHSFWDDPVGNLTIVGGLAISVGATASTFGLSTLTSIASWTAGISYSSAAVYSVKQIVQGDENEGLTNLLRTTVSAFTFGLLNGVNVNVFSQEKMNFSGGSIALEQTLIPSISISFNNNLVYDALLMERVTEVNSGIATQNVTYGSNDSSFKFEELNNMTKKEILDNLPDDWTYVENNGFIHIRDSNGVIRMRLDPPDKMTNYPHVHIYDSQGNSVNINGIIVDRRSPEAHIPYKSE